MKDRFSLQKVFLISSNPLVCPMIELSLKKAGIEVYSLSNKRDLGDCHYKIRDFSPDVLLVELHTLHEIDYKTFLTELNSFPVVGILQAKDEAEAEDKVAEVKDYFVGFLFLPLSPYQLKEKITQLVINSPKLLV